MEKIEKEIKTTIYVANDGKEFDTEYECRKYESSELCELLNKLKPRILCKFGRKNIPFPVYSIDCTYYAINPKTRNDYYCINRILELGQCNDRVEYKDDYQMYVLGVMTGCNIVESANIINMDAWIRSISNNRFTVVTLTKDTEEQKKSKKIIQNT